MISFNYYEKHKKKQETIHEEEDIVRIHFHFQRTTKIKDFVTVTHSKAMEKLRENLMRIQVKAA